MLTRVDCWVFSQFLVVFETGGNSVYVCGGGRGGEEGGGAGVGTPTTRRPGVYLTSK